jgi:hypothetical protein
MRQGLMKRLLETEDNFHLKVLHCRDVKEINKVENKNYTCDQNGKSIFRISSSVCPKDHMGDYEQEGIFGGTVVHSIHVLAVVE